MRATVLSMFFLCFGVVHPALGRNVVKIQGARSPDGNFVLAATMDGGTTCRVEVQGKTGKIIGKFTIADYEFEDRRNSITAVWKEDSSAFTLNVDHGPNLTNCRVFANDKGAWSELLLPAKPIDKVRKVANETGGKAQDFLSAQSWLPGHKLKLSYTGNLATDYALILRLVRSGKAHLEYLQTIAPKATAQDTPPISEFLCTFRILAGGPEGGADGPIASARFKGPSGVAVDAAGSIFVADRVNETLRRITTEGAVETLAGSVGEHGAVDGLGKAARFWSPQGLAIDGDGNVYVADTSGKSVRKITPKGEVSTMLHDLKFPTGVAADRDGNVFVADANDYVIQKIARDGTVSILAGKAGEPGAKNGRAGDARFRFPNGVAVGGNGVIYVTDRYAIRKIDAKGNVTTLAGSFEEQGRNDGAGAAARFWGLTSIAIDASGILYVADHELKNLRRVTPTGVVQTLRTADHTDPPLQNPMGMAIDAHGRIYVADQNANTILLVEPAGGRTPLAK